VIGLLGDLRGDLAIVTLLFRLEGAILALTKVMVVVVLKVREN
jgi:hypothetical protein